MIEMTKLKKLERVKILCKNDLAPDLKQEIIENLSGVALSHQGKYL
jgi:hypothetical protein